MSVDVVTTTSLRQKKQKGEKITMLTGYDFTTARLLDEAGIDIILVGDSLGQVVLGYDSTLPVTLEEMIHHAKAVVRAVERAMVVVDMPFLSFQISPEEALANAGAVVKEVCALPAKFKDGRPTCEPITIAVKIEGGETMAETIRAIVEAGIPVMGHIGMQPMLASLYGGPRVHGRNESEAERILNDARIIEEAGAFAVVLELVPQELAKRVTEILSIPTIGIGAGPHCDGQVLVSSDMLGLYRAPFKHVKRYADLADIMLKAFKAYIEDVKTGAFPNAEHSF
jgi:3-methyl-2-oxobutanoate hydroxymethyltransferase